MSTSTRILMTMLLTPATIFTWPGVAAGSPATISNAAVAPENGVCEEGELCLYDLPDQPGPGDPGPDPQQGPVYDFSACTDVPSYVGRNFINSAVPLDDYVSFIWNRSGYVYEVYELPNYLGNKMTIFSGEYEQLGSLDNAISSHKCVGS
jgi:hypothetical protein